ncbi:hypothetical protein Tco_1442845, partial [Tanacetum coccineum]
MAPLRHPWLRYKVEGYTPGIVHSYEQRLETIWSRPVNRVHVLDFEGQTPRDEAGSGSEVEDEFLSTCRMSDAEMGLDVVDTLCFQLGGSRKRMMWRQFILALGLHTEQEMAEAGFEAYWAGSDRLIPDKGDLRDYWMEISSDRDFLGPAPSYAPEKVTGVDLFYLRSIDRGTTNVPHLLAQYLFRHEEGRKSEARLLGGHFIGGLAMHFGLVSDEGLKGLQATAVGAHEADEAGPAADERIKRLEEDVHDLRCDVVGLRGDAASFTTEQSRVSTWMISCMTQLMDASRLTYQPFDNTFIGSSGLSFRMRVRPRMVEASTSTAHHTDAQPEP